MRYNTFVKGTSLAVGLPLLLTALILAGCSSDDSAVVPVEEPEHLMELIPPVKVAGAASVTYASMEEASAAARRHAALDMAIAKAIRTASTWHEADARARELLASPPPEAHGAAPEVVEQLVAGQMLLYAYLKGVGAPPEPGEADVLASYVARMVEHRNPSALILQPALERLSGHWSDDQIRHAAAVVFEAATAEQQAAVGKAAACADCERVEEMYMQNQRIATAVKGLRAREEAALSMLATMAR